MTSSSSPTTLQEALKALEERDAALAEQQERIAKLEGQLNWLQRQVFGPKSEKLGREELALFEGTDWLQQEQQKPEAEPEPQRERVTAHERKKPGGKRKPLSEELPRVEREHDLPEEQKFCPHTGERLLKWIGTDRSEQLAYEPASAYVIEHVQHKYVRLEENLDGTQPEVMTAEKPQEGLAKSIAAPSLLAAVAVAKFADHLPLYRLERMLGRCGISAARSSMCRWMQDVADLLVVLVELMEESILRSGTIQADDTPTRQQAPGRGKTKTCQFWSYGGDGIWGGRYVVYRYTSDRTRAGPESFFTDENGHSRFSGKLQCDAYSGFQGLFATGSKWRITEVGCWAHVRRKFYDARTSAPGPARWAVDKIRELYRIEARARAWNLSAAQMRVLRARRARPIVEEIFQFCERQWQESLPRGKLAEALGYTLRRGDALWQYLYDGHLEIDNNACERSLRGIAIGRKNWLFTGSEEGGHAAAVLFSLIGSCHLHGVDPQAYLTDVITRLPQTRPEQLPELLPDRWSPANASITS